MDPATRYLFQIWAAAAAAMTIITAILIILTR